MSLSPPREPRDKVFICYSRKDKDWLARLKTHLQPYIRDGRIDVWSDEKIEPGRHWKADLQNAIQRARVALLLVTPDFLASDFVMRHEIPDLLDAAHSGALTLLWLPLKACAWKESPFAVFEALFDPRGPLSARSEAQQDECLTEVARATVAALERRLEARKAAEVTAEGRLVLWHPDETAPAGALTGSGLSLFPARKVDTWLRELRHHAGPDAKTGLSGREMEACRRLSQFWPTLSQAAGVLALSGGRPACVGWTPRDTPIIVLESGHVVLVDVVPPPEEDLRLARGVKVETLPVALLCDSRQPSASFHAWDVRYLHHELWRVARSDAHLRFLARWLRSEEARTFIEPSVTSFALEVPAPALAELHAWRTSGSSTCILTGRLGAGRTTLVRRYAAELAQEALFRDGIPVLYLDFREQSPAFTLEDALEQQIPAHDLPAVRFGLDHCGAVVIADGLDEPAEPVAGLLKRRIPTRSATGGMTRSPTLIVSRNSLFPPASRFRNELLKHLQEETNPGAWPEDLCWLEIQDLSRAKAEAAARLSGMGILSMTLRFRSVAGDALALATRPGFLPGLRAATALEGRGRSSLAAQLDAYLLRWARWTSLAEPRITSEDMVELAEAVALLHWISAHPSQNERRSRRDERKAPTLQDLVDYLAKRGATAVEHWLGEPLWWEICHGSLVTTVGGDLEESPVGVGRRWRPGQGTRIGLSRSQQASTVQFTHEIFGPFLLARRIARLLANGDPSVLDLPPLNQDVIAWVGAMPAQDRVATALRAILEDRYVLRISENALLLAHVAGLTSSQAAPWQLQGARLAEQDLSRPGLAYAHLSNALLSGAKLSGADLRKADLRRIDAPEADFRAANLSQADLSGANLVRADLEGVNAAGAQAVSIRAQGARVGASRWCDADLSGADLRATRAPAVPPDLTEARLDGVRLDGVEWVELPPIVAAQATLAPGLRQWRDPGRLSRPGEWLDADTSLLPPRQASEHLCGAWSPGGRLLLVGHSVGFLSLCCAASGVTVTVWRAHRTSVSAVAWSPDGRRLASGDRPGRVVVWDAHTLEPLWSQEDAHEEVFSLDWSPGSRSLAIGRSSGQLAIHSEDGTCLYTGRLNGGRVRVRFSPDGTSLAASNGAEAVVLSTPTGEERMRLTISGERSPRCGGLAWSPDGRRLAIGAVNGPPVMWLLPSGVSGELPSEFRNVEEVPNQPYLVTTEAQQMLVYEPDRDRVVSRIPVARSGSLFVSPTPDGEHVLVMDWNDLALWPLAGDRPLWCRKLPPVLIAQLEWRAEQSGGSELVLRGEGGFARWRVEHGEWANLGVGREGTGKKALAIAPGGDVLVVQGEEWGQLSLTGPDGGEERPLQLPLGIERHQYAYHGFRFSPGGRHLAVCLSGTVCLWHPASNPRVEQFRSCPALRFDDVLCVLEDAVLLQAERAGDRRGVALVPIDQDRPTFWIAIDNRWISTACALPDLSLVVIGGDEGWIGGLNLSALQQAGLRPIERPGSEPRADGSDPGYSWPAAFEVEGGGPALTRWVRRLPNGVSRASLSPDGALVAAASYPDVYLLRASDGAVVRTLQGQLGGNVCLAFSPDGRLVASASTDCAARVWRVSDGALVSTLHQWPEGVVLEAGGYARRFGEVDEDALRLRFSDGRCASPDLYRDVLWQSERMVESIGHRLRTAP